MSVPSLHLISDRRLCPLDQFPCIARRAVAGGVDAVHVREKDLAGRPLLEVVSRLRDAVAGRALVFVNERIDIALLAGAGGVQLGETAMTPAQARQLAGDRLLIGRSVHSAAGASEAESAGADFVMAGNVFPSRSKPGSVGRGLEFVAEIRASCRLPLIAIGGITAGRVAEVLQAGASGVAVISGILAATDPADAAAHYRAQLERFSLEASWN